MARARSLTEREPEVLRALAAGLSNPEIGSSMHISNETVKSHIKRILSKLDLRDRTQAVVWAYRSGFLEDP